MDRKYKVWEVINVNENLSDNALVDKLELMYANGQLDTIITTPTFFGFLPDSLMEGLVEVYGTGRLSYSLPLHNERWSELSDIISHLSLEFLVERAMTITPDLTLSCFLPHIQSINTDQLLTIIESVTHDDDYCYIICVLLATILSNNLMTRDDTDEVMSRVKISAQYRDETMAIVATIYEDSVEDYMDELLRSTTMRVDHFIRAVVTCLSTVSLNIQL